MAAQQQQEKMNYAVTLVVEGARLDTMSKRAKDAFGDALLRVEKVEKVPAQGGGEWKLGSVDESEFTGKHENWECSDGRTLRYNAAYMEDGVQIDEEYHVFDQHGKVGKYKTMEEAQAATRRVYTPQEIQTMADGLAEAVWRHDSEKDDFENLEDQAQEYLTARRIKLEYRDPDEEKTKAQSEYIVTMRVKGSTLPAVEKKAKAAWGDKVRIEHVRRKTSNQDLLNDAQEHVEEAVEIIAELQEAMEERRDNTPENFQGTETYSAVEEAVEALGSLKDEVEGVVSSFDNIEFPGW
jgi:hypothetical protein